jgi:thioredoxin 1
MIEITQEELKQKIQNGDKLLIDFHALWCGPCKVMKPTFEKVAKKLIDENSSVKLYTMDVDKNRELAVELGLRGVPTIKSFSDGKEVNTSVGMIDEGQINKLIETLVNG